MPSSIAHMLISRKVRERLAGQGVNIAKFNAEVLEKNSAFMELGSIGPDLPYYESFVKGGINLLLDRSDKPMGVDQWSYQLHSKEPNVFPLKMIEIIWKETAIEKKDWESDDYMKFAFVCGYLTHMAVDQTIHPLVNLIAGPYYKRGEAREKHRECEVYQDVYIYKSIYGKKIGEESFNKWCDIMPGMDFSNGLGTQDTPVWFRYLIQKAFVEAHAVMPTEESIENWAGGILLFMRAMSGFGPFIKAEVDLEENKIESNKYTEKYKEYVLLEGLKKSTGEKKEEFEELSAGMNDRTYAAFFNAAVDLAEVYVKAAYMIFEADELKDDTRKSFKEIVSAADLGAPLEKRILARSKSFLSKVSL